MPASTSQLRNRIVTFGKHFFKGLYAIREGSVDFPDVGQIEYTTGTTDLPDISPVAGTYTLIPAGAIGSGIDITTLALYNTGQVAWNGTGATVSLTIQGTDGTFIASYQAQALTASGATGSGSVSSISISTGSTPPTGVTDDQIRRIGQTVAKGVGVVAVVSSNSTAGSPLRLRLTGRAMP